MTASKNNEDEETTRKFSIKDYRKQDLSIRLHVEEPLDENIPKKRLDEKVTHGEFIIIIVMERPCENL